MISKAIFRKIQIVHSVHRWTEWTFARFQELIDLTIRYGRQGESLSARSAMWEELCRFRELYCAAFEERNLPELAAANRYLDQFASMR